MGHDNLALEIIFENYERIDTKFATICLVTRVKSTM